MKKLLVLCMFIMVAHAHAFTLNDLVGTYKVTLKEAPVVSTITVKANGTVEIVETSPVDEVVCTGFARIENDDFLSRVTCNNGAVVDQRVSLSQVKSLDAFSAMVYSSGFGGEVLMDFVKLN